jgi:hypothetical protein
MLGAGSAVVSAGALRMQRGAGGLAVHSGATQPTSAGHDYGVRQGRILTNNVNVSWALADAPPGAGGFIVASGCASLQHPTAVTLCFARASAAPHPLALATGRNRCYWCRTR